MEGFRQPTADDVGKVVDIQDGRFASEENPDGIFPNVTLIADEAYGVAGRFEDPNPEGKGTLTVLVPFLIREVTE